MSLKSHDEFVSRLLQIGDLSFDKNSAELTSVLLTLVTLHAIDEISVVIQPRLANLDLNGCTAFHPKC